jgi:hypothetical protein
MILMIIGVIGAAVIAVIATKGPTPAESEIIRRRYKDLVVPVTDVPTPIGAVINVPDIATLAKLAKRYALLILHGVQDGRDIYLIQDESTTYRYLGEQHAAQFVPQTGPPLGGDPRGAGDAGAPASAASASALLSDATSSAGPPATRRSRRTSHRRPGKQTKNTHPVGPPMHAGAPMDPPPQGAPFGVPASGPLGPPRSGDPQSGPPGPPPMRQPQDQHPLGPPFPAPPTDSGPGSPIASASPQGAPSWPPPPPDATPTSGPQPEQDPQP